MGFPLAARNVVAGIVLGGLAVPAANAAANDLTSRVEGDTLEIVTQRSTTHLHFLPDGRWLAVEPRSTTNASGAWHAIGDRICTRQTDPKPGQEHCLAIPTTQPDVTWNADDPVVGKITYRWLDAMDVRKAEAPSAPTG